MLIDYQELTADALYGLCREHVISHLTDSDVEVELESWIQMVVDKVKSGELVIEFAEVNQSVVIKNRDEVAFDEQ
ncbi:YheU family protein [Aliikangiella sp. G2MR2-5]|uniref:YheU family protein n=1 Tax=Aliikangiella sp. G2MR2-5 TaxID=2788943 RepID=UPI0018AA7DB4|nr:YheU family protein [Aliikangiella sp. G2MR2-5]